MSPATPAGTGWAPRPASPPPPDSGPRSPLLRAGLGPSGRLAIPAGSRVFGSVVAVASGGGARGWRAQTTDSLRRSGGVAEHYVAEAGGWLIDADGACPPAVMLRRWREREGISRPHLVRVTSMSDEMESQRADYVCPAAAVSEIDAALRAALGPPDAYELDVPPRFSTTSATVSGLYDAVRSACVSRPREVAATLRDQIRDAE